jgi:hypothetical protein
MIEFANRPANDLIRSSRRVAFVVLLFLVGLVATLYAVQEYQFYDVYRTLRLGHEETQGQIVWSLPWLQLLTVPTTTYTYTVDGVEYEGITDGARSVFSKHARIWYNPLKPQQSTVADADINELFVKKAFTFWGEVILALAAFAWAAILVVRRLKRFAAEMRAARQ